MNNSNPTLRKTHKVLKKITKKLGNPDLYFSAQLGIDSTKDSTVQTWAAYVAAPRDGLAPITVVAFSKEEFMQKLEDFLKNKVTEEQLEVAYHEGQILANERSTEYHQEAIDKIKNPEPEAEATPEVSEETEVIEEESKAE